MNMFFNWREFKQFFFEKFGDGELNVEDTKY